MDNITLDTPANNSTEKSISQSIICDIEYVNTAFDNYEFELDTTPNFNSQLYETSHGSYYSGSWIYKSNTDLRYGQKYYWRAKVRNTNDTSQWSSVWNFKTAYELTEIPILVAPENSSSNISYTSFSIDWDAITGANNYQYQISSTYDFTSIIRSGNTSLTDRTITNLQANTMYYWRVRGENVNGYSNWSEVWDFTTETAIMTAPILQTPTNNSVDMSYATVNFNWQDVFGANEYIFEISQDNTFATGVTSQNVSNSNNSLSGLNIGTQYFWRVVSTDGSTTSSWSEVWNFTTESDLIDIPTLVSPTNGATNQSLSPRLNWNAVTGATMYEYQYSTNSSFTSFNNDFLSGTNATISGLNNSYTYYWRVRASDGTDWSGWSTIWSFTIEDASSGLATPTLISPADNVTNITTSPSLLWNVVPTANEYEYQYSTDETFATYYGNTTQSTSISIGVLDYSTEYFWRIQATDGADYSDWSEIWSFTTENASSGLVTPTLISPSNNAVDQELSLTLLWNIVPTANEYEYQYSTDETFSTYLGSTTQSTSISIASLENNIQYFWRIQATDGTNYSDWSEIWNFTTKTGIGIKNIKNSITIYPNPTNNALHISLNENIKYISVFNIVGKKVFEQNIANNNYTLNTTSFHNGIYLITLKLETGMISKRFIVKH